MSIEEEIFKRSIFNEKALIKYGFILKDDCYIYHKDLPDKGFEIIITISKKHEVKGIVMDLAFNEEYKNFRIENSGAFSNIVLTEFTDLLNDIKEKCTTEKYFINDQSNRIANKIKEIYGDSPEFLFADYPGFGIFRNQLSNKWYGLIMNVTKNKLTKNNSDNNEIEIMNLKLKEETIQSFKENKNIYPAYHMSKKYWISLELNNSLEDDFIMHLIQESYSLCSNKSKNKK